MAAKATHAPGEIPCPDPSVHEKQHRISEQASTAALLVTQQNRNGSSKETPLNSDGKLSSRSAAHSLKAANPQDLPSFPIRGTTPNSANAAAMLAKDHKMKELWQPEMSSAGSKAAVQAHNKGGNVDLWHPSASAAGNSAAMLAFRNKGLSPQIDRGISDASRNNSLLAAAKSVHAGRQRSDSTPVRPAATYPDAQNSTKNALNAATVSHRYSAKNAPDGWDSEANQAARIKNSNMDREFFTENPQLELEGEDEKGRKAALRASAVSMAKGLYEHQNRAVTPTNTGSGIGSAGAETAHRRNQSSISTPPDIKEQALQYIHLQDAAHRLAQERLDKVEKEMEQGRYRQYYGYPDQKKSRLSVRGRGRKRASSEGQYDSDDEEQARQIRRQMSQLTSASRTAESGQRQEDRARLMAAAEKRVHAQMHDMDEKVFADTGKVPQSMLDEWEAKAREKAEKDREQREKHPGMTHIGGGKYMDQAEIEAIAAARLKSTLDEITETAEKRRARDEEYKRQIELQETAKMEEKIKDEQTKTELKEIKEQDKKERRAAEKAKKDQEHTEKMEKNMKDEQMKVEFKRIKEQDKAAAKRAKEERQTGEKFRTQEDERDEAAAANDTVAFNEAADVLKTDDEREGNEKTKDKTNRRSIFGRVVDRFKSHGEENKRTDESKTVDQKRSVEEEPEKPGVDTTEKEDKPEGAAVLVLAATGAGVAGAGVVGASGTDDEYGVLAEKAVERHSGTDDEYGIVAEKAVDRHDQQEAADVAAATVGSGVVDESDIAKQLEVERGRSTERSPGRAAAILAATAAVGAGTAGAVAFGRTGRRSEEDEADVSSLSTDEDDHDEQLYAPTTSEHDGSYNFASPSPVAGRNKPNLERHISTIQSSGSDSDPDGLSDSDSDYFTQDKEAPDVIDQAAPTVIGAGASKAVDVPAGEPTQLEKKPSADSVSPLEKRDVEKRDSSVSPIPVDVEEGGKIIIVNRDAPPDAEHVDITSRAESPVPEKQAEPNPEPTAPAPVVKTGPSADERTEPQQDDKERKGVRGFFRKLKERQKPNKLKKSNARAVSGESSEAPEKSFKGGAKLGEAKEPDDDITPVTTTSAGKTEQGLLPTEHVGTDGPIGDGKHVSGIDGDPRATSPSSFRRHDQDLNNLDDASSSGVEEEDLERGRGGRLAQKLGLTKAKGKEVDTREPQAKDSNVGAKDDEQLEESRDEFDESLAPPAAYAGQAKSESPSRGTRFREDL